jgi:hypothetical protein
MQVQRPNQCWPGTQFDRLEVRTPVLVLVRKNGTGIGSDFSNWN